MRGMATKKTKTTKKKSGSRQALHPQEELASLVAALEGAFPPAVVLRGEELHFRLAGARAVASAAAARGYEICRHDAKDPEFAVATLLDDLMGGALFASARCIVIENAHALLVKGAKGYSPALVSALVARLAAGSPGTVVLGADALRADHAVVRAATAAGGRLVDCRRLWETPPPWDPDPRRSELVQWLLSQARERRVALTPDEAVYVAAATGNDLSALLDRLEQLRGRGDAALRQLVPWDSGGSPWDLADRLIDGDAARAVSGIEALFQGGFRGRDGERTADPGALVTLLNGALQSRLRETATAAEAVAAGATPEAAAEAVGVRGGPRALQALRARLGRRPPQAWRRMLDDAASLERRSRSGATVDANDYARLALRWAVRGRR